MEARNPNAFNWWPVVEAAFNAFRQRHAPHIPPWTQVTPQERASWLTIVTTVSHVVAPFGVGVQPQELRKIISERERDLLNTETLLRNKEQENRALGQVLKRTREQVEELAKRIREAPKLPVNTPVNRSGRFESIGFVAAQHKFHIGLEDFLRKVVDDDEPFEIYWQSDEQREYLKCIVELLPGWEPLVPVGRRGS